MENPKVSVIVPVYKVDEYLARCLESIVHQTLKEIEVIVVDEGDMDRCRSWSPTITSSRICMRKCICMPRHWMPMLSRLPITNVRWTKIGTLSVRKFAATGGWSHDSVQEEKLFP